VKSYPDGSFDDMRQFASTHGLPFSYLHDEEQSVARVYGAVCTPDFFGYDGARRLRYRARLDEGRNHASTLQCARRASEAMRTIATGRTPAIPILSVGCAIKWKAA
jgi:peroxiredoxin